MTALTTDKALKKDIAKKSARVNLLFPKKMTDVQWQAEILGQAMLIMEDSPRLAKKVFRYQNDRNQKCYCTFGAIRRAIAEWEWNAQPEREFRSKEMDSEDQIVGLFSYEIQKAFGGLLERSLSDSQRAIAAKYRNENHFNASKEVISVNDAKGTRKDAMVRVLRRASVLAQSMVGHRAEKP